jgi:hypothetical protein
MTKANQPRHGGPEPCGRVGLCVERGPYSTLVLGQDAAADLPDLRVGDFPGASSGNQTETTERTPLSRWRRR